MNQLKYLLIATFVSALLFALPITSFGQAVEPSHEVSLQILIGSNEAGERDSVPKNLAAISSQLKSTFAFSNYRLAGTFLGRVSNGGNFEYKSLSNIFGRETDYRSQTFMDWSIVTLREGATPKGEGFQAQAFRLGARVPVTTEMIKDAVTGKERSVVNYEPIGLSLVRLGLSENTPTLIGTLSLPGANDTLFLIMTVKSADL